MHELPDIIRAANPLAHTVAYADDAYVLLPFKNDLVTAKNEIEKIFSMHARWLESLGMCCNSSKTEIMIFGPPVANISFNFNNCQIEPVKKFKVLGIFFNPNLKWTNHISHVIKKASQGNYSLRILKPILPHDLFITVIQSNFLCHFTYGMPVWAGCLLQAETKRLETSIMKTYRLVCSDFRKLLSNYEVCRRANLRSFNSLRLLNDAIFLHKPLQYE